MGRDEGMEQGIARRRQPWTPPGVGVILDSSVVVSGSQSQSIPGRDVRGQVSGIAVMDPWAIRHDTDHSLFKPERSNSKQ
jgi:hypothetical protein